MFVVSFCKMHAVTQANTDKILVMNCNGYEFKKMRPNWCLIISRECVHAMSLKQMCAYKVSYSRKAIRCAEKKPKKRKKKTLMTCISTLKSVVLCVMHNNFPYNMLSVYEPWHFLPWAFSDYGMVYFLLCLLPPPFFLYYSFTRSPFISESLVLTSLKSF